MSNNTKHENRRFNIPEIVEGRAKAAGDIGLAWLENIETLVCEMEVKWGIQVTDVLTGGSHALVTLAEGETGEKYVMKLDVPDNPLEEYMREITALKIADGNGYGKLYSYDPEKRACLIERLGKPLKALGYPIDKQIEIICNALNKTWKMSIGDEVLMDGSGGIDWFREYIPDAWERMGMPCSRRVINQALAYLDDRKDHLDPDHYVVVHGDAHNNNTLITLDGVDFKLIDPDGIYYEKAYDLGVLMREWPEEYQENALEMGKKRCRLLADLTGADEKAIWQWGFLQTVSTSMILLEIGQKPLAEEMLKTAELWCEQ